MFFNVCGKIDIPESTDCHIEEDYAVVYIPHGSDKCEVLIREGSNVNEAKYVQKVEPLRGFQLKNTLNKFALSLHCKSSM